MSRLQPTSHFFFSRLNERLLTASFFRLQNLPVGQTLYEHMAVYGPIFTADNVTDGLINMNDVVQLKYD